MAAYEELDTRQYLVEEFAAADREFGEYVRSGDTGALLSAGEILCRLFRTLDGDDLFWLALREATVDGAEAFKSVAGVLAELRQVEDAEKRLLIDLGVSEDRASRLVFDAMNALNMVEDLRTLAAVENFKGRVADLRERVCEAPMLAPRDRHRSIEKGLNAAGGVATVVVDGGGAFIFLPMLASMLCGGAMIWNATGD